MKLDTPEYRKIFTPELQQLLDIFQRHGYEIRLAGGPVRCVFSSISTQIDVTQSTFSFHQRKLKNVTIR